MNFNRYNLPTKRDMQRQADEWTRWIIRNKKRILIVTFLILTFFSIFGITFIVRLCQGYIFRKG